MSCVRYFKKLNESFKLKTKRLSVQKIWQNQWTSLWPHFQSSNATNHHVHPTQKRSIYGGPRGCHANRCGGESFELVGFYSGFRKEWYREIGEYTLKSVANVDTVNAIYVYCNVIESRAFGHTLAPLIGVLPVTGKPGAYVSKRYNKIQYHPVLKKNISDIYVLFRDD